MKMDRIAFLMLLFYFPCIDAFAQGYKYNEEVTLEGTLVFPTASPEVTGCDKPHQFPAINLPKPISIECEPQESGCLPESDVILLHLIMKQPQLAKFKKLKGKKGSVRGILFHAESGHDFTSVLMNVNAITP